MTDGKSQALFQEQKLRMRYLGVLKLLCDASLLMGSSEEAEEMRETIERVLTDARDSVPRLRWKRVLQRFEIELVDP